MLSFCNFVKEIHRADARSRANPNLILMMATCLFLAWIGSIAFGMNFLFGPLVSGLALRYGCRVVGCAGGIISALGLLLTSFANSIYVIYVTYSLLWGLGSSLCYGTTMMILGK